MRKEAMNRTVITAECVSKAHSLGEKQLSVPYSAIITPAAWDTAAACGMAIDREKAPVRQGSIPGKPEQGGVKADAVPAGGAQIPPPAENDPAPSQRDSATDALFREIKRRVTEQLPPSLRGNPLVDELIGKCLEVYVTKSSGKTADVAPVVTDEAAAVPPHVARPATVQEPRRQWLQTAGKAIRVDSRALPWKASALGKGVNVIDVVGKEAPFSAGYMEWNASSFSWTLDASELFTVLEGELHVSVAGEKLSAGPGDFIFLPQGSLVEMSSPGYVKFACAACSASSRAGA